MVVRVNRVCVTVVGRVSADVLLYQAPSVFAVLNLNAVTGGGEGTGDALGLNHIGD